MTADRLILAAVAAGIAYFGVVAALGLALSLALRHRAKKRIASRQVLDEARSSSRRWAPPLSVAVVPSADDNSVVETISAVLGLNFPDLEVIVVADGTHGSLFGTLLQAFDFRRTWRVYRHEIRTLHIRGVYASANFPRLLLVDKDEGGAADALNAAANIAANPLFAYVTPGMRLDAFALYRLLEDFLHAPESVVAAVTPMRVAGGGPADLVHQAWRLELALPPGDGWTGVATCASAAGSFLVVRKKALEIAGGFRPFTRVQRIDIPFRLLDKLRGWGMRGEIRATPEPVAWEVPESTLGSIVGQHAGLLQALGRHGWTALRDGPMPARLAILYLALFEVLTPFAALAAMLALPALWAVGRLDPATLGAAAALIFGGPFLRAGIATLAECVDRDRYGADHAARRFVGVLLSPLALPLFALARALAVVPLVRRTPKRVAMRLQPMVVAVPPPLPPVAPPPPLIAPPPVQTIAGSPPPPLTWATPGMTPTPEPLPEPAENPLFPKSKESE